jgi:hypothetical protein
LALRGSRPRSSGRRTSLASGLKVDVLVSLFSPVRKDMEAVAKLARANVRQWVHVHTDWSDYIQILGGLFDGSVGFVRQHPLADVNINLPGVGHSNVLRDPSLFHHWEEQGLVDALKGA